MVWQDLPYACALYPVADAPPPSHVRDANNGGSGTRGVKDFADDGGAQETPTTAEVATMAASAPAPPPQGNQGGGKGLAGSSTTPRILEDAAAEARAFVRRLSAHPSVVCWGGNNEARAPLLVLVLMLIFLLSLVSMWPCDAYDVDGRCRCWCCV